MNTGRSDGGPDVPWEPQHGSHGPGVPITP